ncbi:unnamed protein product [Caenorhabditis nigoni]
MALCKGNGGIGLKRQPSRKNQIFPIRLDSAEVISRKLLPDSYVINFGSTAFKWKVHDNEKPHKHSKIRYKLHLLGIEVLPCPSYTAELAQANYYHIRFLQNRLAGEKVHDRKDVKKFLEHCFASKSPEFYANGIPQLPLRWQEVMNSNGELISQ